MPKEKLDGPDLAQRIGEIIVNTGAELLNGAGQIASFTFNLETEQTRMSGRFEILLRLVLPGEPLLKDLADAGGELPSAGKSTDIQ